jgi:hypothetical protein
MAGTPIGSVIIYWTGENPYVCARQGSWVGPARVGLLKDYKAIGVLPNGVSLWDDSNKKDIASPDEIDWSGLS